MNGSTISAPEYDALHTVVECCDLPDVSVPVPWDALTLLGRLIPCDLHTVTGLAPPSRTSYLVQEEYEGQHHVVSRGPAEPDPAEPDPVEVPFWTHYPSSLSCHAPDRPGMGPVTSTSDFYTERQWWSSPMRTEYLITIRWELMLAFNDGGPRTFRLLFFRERGLDFTEKERFFLTLLLPHIEQRYRRWQAESRDDRALTHRQTELLAAVARGLTNRQVGRALGLTEATVRTHLGNIYQRLGVSCRTEAVSTMQHSSPATRR